MMTTIQEDEKKKSRYLKMKLMTTMALLFQASVAKRAGGERRAAAVWVSQRTGQGSDCEPGGAQDDATARRQMMILLQRTHSAASATSAERGARERARAERRACEKI